MVIARQSYKNDEPSVDKSEQSTGGESTVWNRANVFRRHEGDAVHHLVVLAWVEQHSSIVPADIHQLPRPVGKYAGLWVVPDD